MAWDQLWISKAHISYALIGGFVTLFSLVSLFVKEKLYIGEATVATIFGVIVGPHCLNWFAPTTWGNTDNITLEISRVVLVIQIFAVAVELPKKYMLKHWLSVVILLLPVMTFGWLISSVFIWKLVPTLRWVEGLVLAACITATDPVLASAVVGKGKFAKRVPGHLRNILSAESGCNDGMAFPFAYLAINLVIHAGDHATIAKDFIVITVLYECVFGCVLGAIIGYLGRHLIKFAEKKNLIDRESFLSFYFVLALFCTGVGSIIGVDDLLVSFSAGAAFSWDGWFARKTEESHVSNVIDLLINMAFFVYFGAIVPWEQFNNKDLGIEAWKLVILALLVLIFRRLPIVLAMKPFTPDIRTWREALFCGHFGPIGVGAVFISILARAELESGDPTPLATIPPPGSPHYFAVATIWPVTCFLIIASIIVHGSSIAVFTLGKRLNNMTITMSYTTGNANQSWLSRLPRLDTGRSLSFSRNDTEGQLRFGVKGKPAGGAKRRSKTKSKTGDTSPGTSADRTPMNTSIDLGAGRNVSAARTGRESEDRPNRVPANAYLEGDDLILEDADGEVVSVVEHVGASQSSGSTTVDETSAPPRPRPSRTRSRVDDTDPTTSVSPTRRQRRGSDAARTGPEIPGKKITAYQLDNEVIVENEEGDIIRRYRINTPAAPPPRRSTFSGGLTGSAEDRRPSATGDALNRTLAWVGLRRQSTLNPSPNAAEKPAVVAESDVERNDDELILIDRDDSATDMKINEDAMRRHLKALLLDRRTTRDSEGSVSPSASVSEFSGRRPQQPDEDIEEEEADANDGSSSDEGDNGQETEVERHRRLAALGIIRDDEDDEPTDTVHRRLPETIAEADEDAPETPGLRFSTEVRRS